MGRHKKEITPSEQAYDGSTPLPGRFGLMQEMFVEGILRGLSESEAVRQAGYKAKQPANTACAIQKQSHVIARLAYRRAELQAQMQAETGITERRVIDELAKCAFSNMQDFVTSDEDGNIIFRDLEGLSREQMAAVESVKITKQTTTNRSGEKDYQTTHTQFKLHSKTQSLEALGKHLGIFEADNAQREKATPIVLVIGGTFNAGRADPNNPA